MNLVLFFWLLGGLVVGLVAVDISLTLVLDVGNVARVTINLWKRKR